MGLLRLLLALCVVVHHTPKAGVTFTDGGVAVQAFYVISGYFIAMVLCGKYESLPRFYANRFLRLYPVYAAVLALAAAQLLVMGENTYFSTEDLALVRDPLTAAALFFSNVTLLGQEWIVWFDLDPETGAMTPDLALQARDGRIPAWRFLLAPQAWTLSLELAFYAVAPFVVRRRLRVILALALLSLLVRTLWEPAGVDYNIWVRRMFLSEFCLFLLGVLAWRLTPLALSLAGRHARAIGVAATVFLVVLIGFHDRFLGATAAGRAALVLPLAFGLPFIHTAIGGFAFDRRLGDLSYPVYICHILVIALIGGLAPALLNPAVAVAASLAAAAGLYLTIDRPVEAVRRRIAAGVSRTTPPPPAPAPPRPQRQARPL